MFDQNYYLNKKQEIQGKFQKAQQKYFQMCEMLGREYISLQERAVELQAELKEIEEKEKASQQKDKDNPAADSKINDKKKI